MAIVYPTGGTVVCSILDIGWIGDIPCLVAAASTRIVKNNADKLSIERIRRGRKRRIPLDRALLFQ
jgi:hypothetical protein